MTKHQRQWWFAHTVGNKLRCPECGGVVFEDIEDLECHGFEYTIMSNTVRKVKVEPVKPKLRYSCTKCGWMREIVLI